MISETQAKLVKMADYSYSLPEEMIARYPLEKRDNSRMLVCREGIIEEDRFSNISEWLPAGSRLIFNNTKVIPARMIFKSESGARIEVLCLSPVEPVDYIRSLESRESSEWNCMVGNLKKWKDRVLTMTLPESNCVVVAEKTGLSSSEGITVKFSWDRDRSFADILEEAGHVPIPPYLNRDDEQSDHTNYQTVYSKFKGSVAAPTAGLHFTNETLDKLKSRGILRTDLTLHVGAGTFKPVKAEEIGEHKMHEEWFFISRKSLAELLEGVIVAVGTTSARSLESLYILGCKALTGTLSGKGPFYIGQWEGYSTDAAPSAEVSLKALENYMERNDIAELGVSTGIIIVPGYRFRIVKGLVTNFHQPGSTLLLLVAAFIGDDWRRVYDHCLTNGFRFLSYGDSSLLLP